MYWIWIGNNIWDVEVEWKLGLVLKYSVLFNNIA